MPTIEVLDKKFINFFKNFIALYFYWEDYFKKNNVKVVMIMHDTYLTGIPARIAISKEIKTIVPTTQKIYQLNKKIPNTGKEFLFYKDRLGLEEFVKDLYPQHMSKDLHPMPYAHYEWTKQIIFNNIIDCPIEEKQKLLIRTEQINEQK